MRYQLLTALAGTLSEAEERGAQHAVLMVQDFLTDQRPNASNRCSELDGGSASSSSTRMICAPRSRRTSSKTPGGSHAMCCRTRTFTPARAVGLG